MTKSHLLAVIGFCLLLAGCGTSDRRGVAISQEKQSNQGGKAANRDDLSSLMPKGELVEHPTYRQWKAFPEGTTVTRKTTTDSELTPGMTVTVLVTSLKQKTDDFLVLESQSTTTYADGRVNEHKPVESKIPRKIRLPEGMSAENWGKPQGTLVEEEVEAAGKKYRARKTESKGTTDAGDLYQTVWSSDEMPGGLVKSVSKVPAVKETTIIEITEVKVP